MNNVDQKAFMDKILEDAKNNLSSDYAERLIEQLNLMQENEEFAEDDENEDEDEDEKLAEKLREKYKGKLAYCNLYESGGWICNVEDVFFDNADYEIYFVGNRIEFRTINNDDGDGFLFIEKGSDDGVCWYPEYDENNSMSIIDEDEVGKIIRDAANWSLNHLLNNQNIW